MKLKSKELKRMARETLNGRYSLPMAALVLSQVLTLLVMTPFRMTLGVNPSLSQVIINNLAMLIISLLSVIMSCGLIKIHLNMAREREMKLTDLFYFFTRRPDRLILSTLLLVLISLIAMIPFIVVTIYAVNVNTKAGWILFVVVSALSLIGVSILALTFNFIFYLMVDYPGMGVIAAFRESNRMMKGNKGRLFYVMISFLGLSLLSLLSFGIGMLWVSPYMTQTTTKFYLDLKGEIH